MGNTYKDPRLETVEQEREAALAETDRVYETLIDQTRTGYDQLIAAEEDYQAQQREDQQKQTDLEIQKLQQEQAQLQTDYENEEVAAYTDYREQVNPYGVEAEKLAQAGLSRSGYSEKEKEDLFQTYRDRAAVAREGYKQAVREYGLAIQEARDLNIAALAEIAYNTLKKQTELALKAADKIAQLQLKWEDLRLDQEKYFRDWAEGVQEQVEETSRSGAVEQIRRPLSPNATESWDSL